jgi:fructokinase
MSATGKVIVGLGELLWDLLPAGKQLGGAPANFAYHASMLGNTGITASRVGADDLGKEAIEHLTQLQLSTEYIQIDATAKTGTVAVRLSQSGEPSYTITTDVAWDFLEWTTAWQELANKTDAVCFGSLAQRSPQSRETIRQFLQNTSSNTLRVFDVNLRQSFYSPDLLAESFRLAHIAKLNENELREIGKERDIDAASDVEIARQLLLEFDLQLLCVTRGDNGSLLVTESETVEHPGYKVKVSDTIGSGDAFTATLIHYYLNGSSLREISDNANRVGAWVASLPGATPRMNNLQ